MQFFLNLWHWAGRYDVLNLMTFILFADSNICWAFFKVVSLWDDSDLLVSQFALPVIHCWQSFEYLLLCYVIDGNATAFEPNTGLYSIFIWYSYQYVKVPRPDPQFFFSDVTILNAETAVRHKVLLTKCKTPETLILEGRSCRWREVVLDHGSRFHC